MPYRGKIGSSLVLSNWPLGVKEQVWEMRGVFRAWWLMNFTGLTQRGDSGELGFYPKEERTQ